MKLINKLWVALNENLWGFEVCVAWGGKDYCHSAKDIDDALSWASQYPRDAAVQVISLGSDRVIMARNAVVGAV